MQKLILRCKYYPDFALRWSGDAGQIKDLAGGNKGRSLLPNWLPRTILGEQYRSGAVVQAHEVFARSARDTIRTQAQELPLMYRFFLDEAPANS
jgi:hypothetical protein